MRIRIIYNPVAGARRPSRLRRVLRALNKAGVTIRIKKTKRPGHATKRAAKATEKAHKWDLVVAAGGDGTISEAANGLDNRSPPLAVIPLGTANVFARELGIGAGAKRAVETILHGVNGKIYAGLIGRKRFLMMASAGFDAWAVACVSTKIKKYIGPLAYVIAALRAVPRYRKLAYTVNVDGKTYKSAGVVVTRGRLYGGPFVIAPKADLTQPVFQVVLLRKPGIFHAAKYGLALILGLLPRLSDVDIVTAKSVRIDGPRGDPVQADGDLAAELPVTIRMDKRPIAVRIPSRV